MGFSHIKKSKAKTNKTITAFSITHTEKAAAHVSAALPCSPTSTQQPRISNLNGVQKTFLYPCQLLPSQEPHCHTSTININHAFVTSDKTMAAKAMLSVN